MRVYRLAVKWPTPDGRPFKDQPWQVWDDAVTFAAGGNGPDGWPEWLPESVDLLSRVPDEDTGECDRSHAAGVIAHAPRWSLVVWVPHVRRTHYFSRSAVHRLGAVLSEWGCTVEIAESEPVVFA